MLIGIIAVIFVFNIGQKNMRVLFLLLFTIFALSIFGQDGTVVFDRVLHDFELIEEERGVVITEFFFTNTSKERYHISGTKSSCSCATMGVSQEPFEKGDTLSLMVAYDPTGLPGKFNKSIEVSFKNNKGKEIKRHLSIKGLTVSLSAKESLIKSNSFQKENDVSFYYKQEEVDKNINEKTEDYKTFIKRATKVALMHKNVKLLITIYHPEPDFAFEKLLRNVYETINKDLMSEGLLEQSIIFLDPKVELSSQDKYLQVSIINEESYLMPSLQEEVLAEVPVLINGKQEHVQINSAQQMALPIYFQSFRGGLRTIDTNSVQFQEYLEELVNQIKGKEELVDLVVISSASKWVYASDNFDNDYIANLRCDNSLQTLKSQLLNKRINVDKLTASKQVKVIGPAMNKRNYVAFFHRQFQYLKVIPVYKVQATETRGASGFIHYYKESTEALDPRQKKFYSFTDQLVYLIQNEGSVRIRLEGSSSKSGKSPRDAKEKLAYTRIEDLKDNLERELYKRGINPQRLIIVEEQASVQGPDAKKGTEQEFYKAQYVKAIIVD